MKREERARKILREFLEEEYGQRKFWQDDRTTAATKCKSSK